MEELTRQRNRRRERAQRMQAAKLEKQQLQQHASRIGRVPGGDESGEDESPIGKVRPPPPSRRKKPKSAAGKGEAASSSERAVGRVVSGTSGERAFSRVVPSGTSGERAGGKVGQSAASRGVQGSSSNGVPVIKQEIKPNIKEEEFEEDCIDGFAILSFTSYEELETSIKHCGCKYGKLTLGVEPPDKKPPVAPSSGHGKNSQSSGGGSHVLDTKIKVEATASPLHSSSLNNNHHADPSTSDDSCRERVVPLKASSTPSGGGGGKQSLDRAGSHERLSDTSSRCSSGKGYICDSEDEDDKVRLSR
ncbi:hypothetical protein M8J76_012911 [Diaphorina citri]|nr:hypothetical protein M8J76_012911 [Diaphorina citri]